MPTLVKLSWAETKLFVRDPLTLVFTLGLPLINLGVLAGVFGNTPTPEVYRGVGAIDYYIPAYIGLVVAAFGVSVLTLTAFGFLLGSVLPTTRAAQGIGIILYFLMLILGGAGPPPEVLPDAMRLVGDFTPVRYVILILQDPWLGFGWAVRDSLIVAGVMAGATLISGGRLRRGGGGGLLDQPVGHRFSAGGQLLPGIDVEERYLAYQ